MKKVKNVVLGVMMASVLVSGLGMNASAHTYNFSLNPPFEGCAGRTAALARNGDDGPYVFPLYDTTKTTYCLRKAGSVEVISDYIKTGEYGKNYFTYYDRYKGTTTAQLLGYPTYRDFLPYVVRGEWQP